MSGVDASHPGARVLHGIDLTVPAGTTTAVLGPSGCGKTTLLRVVAGFMRPEAGEVWLDDDLVAGPGTWVAPEKRGIGYVAQEGNLFPHLDVARNITYGLPRAERRDQARVAELLELVGLPDDLAARRPDQLSGGQQQRVALARSLARRPHIILLDEPFSSLDPELRTATRDAVAAALRREQATVVLVTHDQGEALSFADQVAIMHEGRLTQVGPPAQVYREPTGHRAALSLGVDVRGESALGDLSVGPTLTWTAGGEVALTEQVGATLELAGQTVFARAFDAAHTPLEGALGVRWREGPFAVGFAIGAGLTPGFGSPDARARLYAGSWIPI